MRLHPTFLCAFLFLLALVAVIPLRRWQATREPSATHPGIFPVSTSQAAAPLPARASPRAATPSAGHPIDRLVKGGELLARVSSPTAAGRHVTSIYRTGFKYPLIRVEDDYSATDAENHPSRRVSMVADHLLVRIENGSQPLLDRFLASHPKVSVLSRLDTGEHVLLSFPEPLSTAAMQGWITLLRQSGLTTAEPDYLQQIAAVPDDSSYPSLWGLHNTGQTGGTSGADIDAQDAWDITTGSSSVIVGIVDSGMDYTHNDLAPNVWSNAAGQHGHDYYDDDNDPLDSSASSHGTHVAGTIGAAGNNGQGVTGVNWSVKMMSVRFIGPSGTGATSDAISCIRFATDNGAKVLNNSWGSSGGSPGDSLDTEIKRAKTHGVLFVAAAANGGDDQIGDDNDQIPVYPANYPEDNIISVAATDSADHLASFSNYGHTTVDLAAPGVSIYSTLPGNRYGLMSGTSMATPHVTGAAALVLAANSTLTYAQVRTRLLGNTDALATLNGSTVSGGRLNAYKAIQDLGGPVLQLTRKDYAVTTGNGDAFLNPGETVALNLTLANTGSVAASSATITAALSAGAPATLNPTQITTASLAPNATLTLDSAFQLTLGNPATLPATFTVTFSMTSPSSTRSWTDTLQLTVRNPATLAGTVTRAATGAPIPGATITIRGPVNHDLVTDSSGHYQVATVAGSFTVAASATGLAASEVRSINATASTAPVDFALGTASLELTPATFDLTVPANQTRTISLNAKASGDTPRDLAFDLKIAGSGLAANVLYGARFTPAGGVELLDLDPATGAQLALRTLPDLSAYGDLYDMAHFNQKLWLLCGQYLGGGGLAYSLVPYDLNSGSLGTPVTLTTQLTWLVKLFAAGQDLLVTTGSDSGELLLQKIDTTTGALTQVATLPATSSGNLTWSSARKSVFSIDSGSLVQEYLYPAFTPATAWPLSSGYTGMAYSDTANALFISAYQFSNGFPASLTVQKRNPATGALISGFTAPADISLLSTPVGGGPGWLTSGVASASVAQGATRVLPLTVNTAGMKTGDQYLGTVTLSGPLLARPVIATVHLTIGDAPDPATWAGWFARNFNRAPTDADLAADPDGDGLPNL
ncbi:MAG: hypothetical protein JWO82_445, partial [Akkermansiaceae bacterium]|nr:hypothetical protein [Akkermansiaceae bacterium]